MGNLLGLLYGHDAYRGTDVDGITVHKGPFLKWTDRLSATLYRYNLAFSAFSTRQSLSWRVVQVPIEFLAKHDSS